MKVKKAIEKLEKSEEFKSFRKKHPDWYLAHVLIMIEPEVDHQYDVGYYGKKDNIMTTFLIDPEVQSIEVHPDQKVFKDPEHELQPLDMSKVKTSYEVAQELAADCQREKYKDHIPMKEIIILQNIKEGQVWNITYVTKTFKTLNVKVSAEKPEIVVDKLVEVFKMD